MMGCGWGDLSALQSLPPDVDAVVSLCQVDDNDLPTGVEQIDVRLIDIVDSEANPNLDFVLIDTVRLIEQLRNEGRTVLLHCVACQSRTPTVAASLDRNDQRCAARAQAWRQHEAQTHARETAYQRITATSHQRRDRERNRRAHRGYGLEL